jgi:hypothetical protein
LYVTGKIEHDGSFSPDAPLEKNTPGISAMLGRLAVLSAIDISYLHTRERALGSGSSSEHIPVHDENIEKDSLRYTQIPRVRTLVRRQTEVMLDDAIRPRVKFDPRRIGTHKMSLPGIIEYEKALVVYNEDGSEESRNVLNFARARVRKPNPKKLEIWPENVERISYEDPITEEIVHANTWVAEFTKPKLTPEQELEIVLWQRNYRPLNTSTTALATFDRFRDLL